MATFTSIAPVLPVRDLSAAIAHYRQLGFTVETYEAEERYGLARRGPVELHLAEVAQPSDVDPAASHVAVYLRVDDADALAAEWALAVDTGRNVDPVDTDYGTREGAHFDPDGNLLRYGSPRERSPR